MTKHINLNGPHGNAFYLLATARRLAVEVGLDPSPIVKEMRAGDYAHLCTVFEKHFGEYVVLDK
jgi:hypothetical protein